MTRENGTHNRGLLAGFSPLAGVSAGTAAVLFVFGVLCLAWHQVSGHVSLAVTVVAYVVMSAVAAAAAAGAWLAVLWVAHRHRNPELLVRRAVRAEVLDAGPVPQAARRRAACRDRAAPRVLHRQPVRRDHAAAGYGYATPAATTRTRGQHDHHGKHSPPLDGTVTANGHQLAPWHPGQLQAQGRPVSVLPQQQDSPGQPRTAADKAGRRRADGLMFIVVALLAAAMVAVVAFSGSWQHQYELSIHLGQAHWVAGMQPLSVEGLIVAATLVIWYAARYGYRRRVAVGRVPGAGRRGRADGPDEPGRGLPVAVARPGDQRVAGGRVRRGV